MAKTLTAGKAAGARTKQDKRAYAQLGHNTWRKAFMQHYWLYILMIPGILYMLIFNYTPMAGLVMAFEDFSPYNGDTAIQALFGSPFAGLKYFEKLFTGPDFWRLLRNTLAISLANLIFAFPAPIILALLLNELRCKWFKRFSQTLVYIPHFVSIVIVAALTYQLFSTTDGVAYHMLVQVFGKQNAPRHHVRSQALLDDDRRSEPLERDRLRHDHLPRGPSPASIPSCMKPPRSTAPAAGS